MSAHARLQGIRHFRGWWRGGHELTWALSQQRSVCVVPDDSPRSAELEGAEQAVCRGDVVHHSRLAARGDSVVSAGAHCRLQLAAIPAPEAGVITARSVDRRELILGQRHARWLGSAPGRSRTKASRGRAGAVDRDRGRSSPYFDTRGCCLIGGSELGVARDASVLRVDVMAGRWVAAWYTSDLVITRPGVGMNESVQPKVFRQAL